ncbi:MAG: hypothetical protein ABJN26_22680 [Stappiaceae bacterium]|uniref:hypothetical protein n=1 Tax=Roseibium sp. TaxID=1936156 RepID=UPI00329813AB
MQPKKDKTPGRTENNMHRVEFGFDMHARTLLDAISYERGIDRQIRDALAALACSIEAEYLICQHGREARKLVFFLDDPDTPKKALKRSKKLQKLLRERMQDIPRRQSSIIDKDPIRGLIIPWRVRDRTEYGERMESDARNFVFYGVSSDVSLARLTELIKSDRLKSEIHTISRIISSVLTRRSSIFSRFPKRFSDAYWYTADMGKSESGQRSESLAKVAPWDQISRGNLNENYTEVTTRGRRSTITLSFDLRRSTRAMERMIDKKAYADWIEAMVMLLRQITIDNNGIFDKFTGDGVLVHFLEEESREFNIDRQALRHFDPEEIAEAGWRTHESSGGHYAAADAMACAFEMIMAVEMHAVRLNQISRKFDMKFGPVVAIAKDVVQWSVDRDGDPIVVGPGVVDACRFTDGARKGEVRVSPHIHEILVEAQVVSETKIKKHRSKETDKDAVDAVVCYKRAPLGLCRSENEIVAIVQTIQNELDGRTR